MIKGKDQSITLTGSWQKLNLPSRYVSFQLYNSASHSVDIAKNQTTVYQTLSAGDTYEYPQRAVSQPYQDELYVKGTNADVLKYEVLAEVGAIDAL